MSQSQTVAEKELPRWDLSDLYSGVDDPKIDEDLDKLEKAAGEFQSSYEGKILQGELSSADLRKALDEFESMISLSTRVGSYASSHYSTKTTDAKRGALLQKIRERSSRVSTKLIFFDLELGDVPEEVFSGYLGAQELSAYKHYLTVQREYAKYHLSQAEETVLEETANCRGRAFRRL
ncbi:MAG: oligoendopeptidase, partial [Candidatus Eremiobacteraeota bacterium]|nr:oligoendopeptidase [Candidatus Eremiobacteraeota bacterium]